MLCTNCGIELSKPDTSVRRKDDFPQYSDALVIDVRGGFGMFFDGPDRRHVLCHDCAASVVKANSWLGLIEGGPYDQQELNEQ
jgi:hypothetical protein